MKISFEVNNKGIMTLEQGKHDGAVMLTITRGKITDNPITISNGDMVMLMNYYRYQKDHNLPIF
jgi:hypothetical protein